MPSSRWDNYIKVGAFKHLEQRIRDGRAGLFCHRAGLERAGLIFVQPGWAGAGWVGLASTHKNRAAGFFPSIN